ncbi:MAG: REP-associated tyrosine transposase [Isosphaeraceae bacterium]
MSQYRRYFIPGGNYFFTVVTHDRRPFLTSSIARPCLRRAIRKVRRRRPFDLVAIVLLPDHLHTVWTLPRGDADYPMRWAQIKESFTRSFLTHGGAEGFRNSSRIGRRERAVWQRRSWEHTCKDEDEVERCISYVHWNPVKHGLVQRVQDYPWSTFHRYVRLGEYDLAWGAVNPCPETDDWECE